MLAAYAETTGGAVTPVVAIVSSTVATSGGVSVSDQVPGAGVSWSLFDVLTFYHDPLDPLVFDTEGLGAESIGGGIGTSGAPSGPSGSVSVTKGVNEVLPYMGGMSSYGVPDIPKPALRDLKKEWRTSIGPFPTGEATVPSDMPTRLDQLNQDIRTFHDDSVAPSEQGLLANGINPHVNFTLHYSARLCQSAVDRGGRGRVQTTETEQGAVTRASRRGVGQLAA